MTMKGDGGNVQGYRFREIRVQVRRLVVLASVSLQIMPTLEER
jgi:hypothetical protein